MEDLSKLILGGCLAMNLGITLIAYELTIGTLEVIPETWHFKKWTRTEFERFVFMLYFLIIGGITFIWL